VHGFAARQLSNVHCPAVGLPEFELHAKQPLQVFWVFTHSSPVQVAVSQGFEAKHVWWKS
jgi:hypothetical protein